MNQQGRNLVKSSQKILDNLNQMMKDLEGIVTENTKKLTPKEAELLARQFENSKLFDMANQVRQTYKDLEK